MLTVAGLRTRQKEKSTTIPKVTNSEFSVAPKGTYLTMLCEIETKTAKQRTDSGGERDSTFWVWKFKGYKTNDPRKVRVPIEITSGTGISSKASTLKSLLMSAYPDMTSDEMKSFNTDEMIGKAWVLKVGVEEKPQGGEKNVILNIEASDEDVFADED